MSETSCPRLSPDPARTDLTDRECAKLLSAHVGGLCQMADIAVVRKAVEWIATSDEYWQWMDESMKAMRKAGL